jgi:hypothetical protein
MDTEKQAVANGSSLGHASLTEMESDLAAVDGLKYSALVKLQELTMGGDQKAPVRRMRVAEFFNHPIQTQQDLDDALQQLKDSLQKFIDEGAAIILEWLMLSPRQVFEDNIRPAELLLKVYRLLEHDTPKTEGELVRTLRELVRADSDEGLMVIYNEIFLGLIRERAEILPAAIKRSALCNLLRQAVVTACTALETYLPALLRVQLVEEELRDTIAEAKRQWPQRPRYEQLSLFDAGLVMSPAEQLTLFDLSGITNEQFWDEAEAKVLASLKEYAKKVSNGKGFQRQLFADDAAHGFAFIDTCQRRFDVMLMNPPFGEGSRQAKGYLECAYPRTKNDVYAAFVERLLGLLHQ